MIIPFFFNFINFSECRHVYSTPTHPPTPPHTYRQDECWALHNAVARSASQKAEAEAETRRLREEVLEIQRCLDQVVCVRACCVCLCV